MRRRLALGLVPVLLAILATLASPQATRAASVTEAGLTVYTVNPAKQEVDVRVTLSIHNNTPNSGGYFYYYVDTYAWVEVEATNVKVTSNAGKVKSAVAKTTNYYRELHLTYPAVYYGQTRVITMTYTIPAAPHSTGGYRAGQAYAQLCAAANGYDSGRLNVVVPDGYQVSFYSGTQLTPMSDTAGLQTFTTGVVTQPYKVWTCAEAENSDKLTSKSVSAAGQDFRIQAWPEDSTWSATVSNDITEFAPKLEELTGFEFPGGTVLVQEAGESQMGEYVGGYDPKSKIASVVESTDSATVAHELSHIWFNKSLFAHTWASEGLAGYSEKVTGTGSYKVCVDPGSAPGGATLATWRYLDIQSTTDDEKIVDWQYDASCYVITAAADAIGPANFRAVLQAASKSEIAYVGAGSPEPATETGAISDRAFLDLIDERGMVPAGIADLDQMQTLFSRMGIVSGSDLDARSTARAAYHTLLKNAGSWKLPYAIRGAMASWQFDDATKAMDAATEILTLRDKVVEAVSGAKLDGSGLQKAFEEAKTRADLDAALELAKKEADAADKVAAAISLNNSGHSVFQIVGLIGSDPASEISAATVALTEARPDDASAAAQRAIDMLDGSANQGMIRLGAGLAVLGVLALGAVMMIFRRRRRLNPAFAGPAVVPFGPSGWEMPGGPWAGPGGEMPPGGWIGPGGAPPAAPPDPSLSANVWVPPADATADATAAQWSAPAAATPAVPWTAPAAPVAPAAPTPAVPWTAPAASPAAATPAAPWTAPAAPWTAPAAPSPAASPAWSPAVVPPAAPSPVAPPPGEVASAGWSSAPGGELPPAGEAPAVPPPPDDPAV